MKRSLVADTPLLVGKKVRLCGWVHSIRAHGQLNFVDIRDRSGIIQAVGGSELKKLKNEFVVSLSGFIRQRKPQNYNPNLPTGQIELQVEKFKTLSPSQDLPFDIHQKTLNLSLPTLLDYRAASLRNQKVQNIFKLQTTIVQAFRSHLLKQGFTEFQAPTIVATATEGGSQVFPVDYFGYKAYLAQSPQFYKQVMVSVFERVFTLAHAYRAEPSVTTRHLTEYIGLDVELGFIDSWLDVLHTADKLVKAIFKAVKTKHQDILDQYQVTIPQTISQTPIVKLSQAQDIVYKFSGHDIRGQPDMDPEAERQICAWARKEFGSEMIFISHFPTKKRPWYTYPDPKNPQETLSFDLIGRGVEWITGGQRLHDYRTLKTNIKNMGANPDDFNIPYLQAFAYGMPPEGGFCIGLERITQNILGLENIRQAALFPRDIQRVDARLSVIGRPFSPVGRQLSSRLLAFLGQQQVSFTHLKHPPVTTCQQAAKARGTPLKQGAKALLMLADSQPILVVLSAAHQINLAKFKKQFKIKKLKMATAAQVKQITGLPPGALPPFGNLLNLPVFVDKQLLAQKQIAFNCGSLNQSVIMSSADFNTLVKPQIGSYAQKG